MFLQNPNIFFLKQKEDLGRISENFDKILTNPLKDFLEKESENIIHNDPANQMVLKDLKGVLNKIMEV